MPHLVALTEVENTTRQLIGELGQELHTSITSLNGSRSDLENANIQVLHDKLLLVIKDLDNKLKTNQLEHQTALKEMLGAAADQLEKTLNAPDTGTLALLQQNLQTTLGAIKAALNDQAERQQQMMKDYGEQQQQLLSQWNTAADRRINQVREEIVEPGMSRLTDLTNDLKRKFVRAVLLLMLLGGFLVLTLTMESSVQAVSSRDGIRWALYGFFLIISIFFFAGNLVLNTILGIKDEN